MNNNNIDGFEFNHLEDLLKAEPLDLNSVRDSVFFGKDRLSIFVMSPPKDIPSSPPNMHNTDNPMNMNQQSFIMMSADFVPSSTPPSPFQTVNKCEFPGENKENNSENVIREIFSPSPFKPKVVDDSKEIALKPRVETVETPTSNNKPPRNTTTNTPLSARSTPSKVPKTPTTVEKSHTFIERAATPTFAPSNTTEPNITIHNNNTTQTITSKSPSRPPVSSSSSSLSSSSSGRLSISKPPSATKVTNTTTKTQTQLQSTLTSRLPQPKPLSARLSSASTPQTANATNNTPSTSTTITPRTIAKSTPPQQSHPVNKTHSALSSTSTSRPSSPSKPVQTVADTPKPQQTTEKEDILKMLLVKVMELERENMNLRMVIQEESFARKVLEQRLSTLEVEHKNFVNQATLAFDHLIEDDILEKDQQ